MNKEQQQEQNELKDELKELKDQYEILENQDNVEEYDEMLDECNEEIEILGMKYNPSHVLSNVDPIAYRCRHSDYNDSLMSDLQDEIDEKQEEIDNLDD